MPDLLSEPILHPSLHAPPTVRESVPLRTLSQSDRNNRLHSFAEESSDQSETDFSDAPEDDPLLTQASSSRSHMKRVTRSSKKRSQAPPAIQTGQNGEINGRTTDNMYRKHAPSTPTSAEQTAELMSRESFTLDEAPPTPATPGHANTSFKDLPVQDKKSFLLLVMLYFLQGIPMGLAMGSLPFLLKSHLSYGQIGIFSLASYPYSIKLLWSPIVDAIWNPTFGRRKSWIVPVQFLSGLSMIYLGGQIDEMMVAAGANGGSGVWNFTGWWFFLVFMCATQDIAVDGWAISLLSISNISYASTAQTVGLTAGSFLSHTIFLALNAPEFANTWLRKTPKDSGLLTLGGYMIFWGWAYIAITIGMALLKREEKTKEREGIMSVYRSMWGIMKLKNIITIIIIHLISKIGFVTNDAVTNLKLLDKGFGQANLALVVMIDFPFEISLGYYAGKWSNQYGSLTIWSWAFVGRLVAAVFGQLVVMIYPAGPDASVPFWYMLTVIFSHVFSTFMNTVMFVAVSAFHARIADPTIGGTYMTLLATVSNLGGTFPKYFILKLVDLFTSATCIPPTNPPSLKEGISPITNPFSCVLEAEKHRCIEGGGTCNIQTDGYYITNIVCVIIGAITFFGFIREAALRLQALPLRAWRFSNGNTR